MTAGERVRRGAALLDRVVPGWERRVRAAAIDISRSDLCVLGQVFGSYEAGLERLDLTIPRSWALGFTTTGVGDAFTRREVFEELAEAWRDLLRERQAEDQLVSEVAEDLRDGLLPMPREGEE